MTSFADSRPAATDIAVAIKMANLQFMKAFQDRDAAQAASLYTQEALLCPPGAGIKEGRSAITGFWMGIMAMGITDVTLETVSVKAFGPTAIERGKYTLIAGAETVDTGKYLVLWRLEDGRWKLCRDIWNTSQTGTKA